jgi:hypothetical protein
MAISDENGDFTFPDVPNGTYVLHVNGGSLKSGSAYDSTDLLIKVNEKAMWDALLLTNRAAGGGSCGGMSLDVRHHRAHPLNLFQVFTKKRSPDSYRRKRSGSA